jgi:lipoprotein-releasing system ATP-binding protein
MNKNTLTQNDFNSQHPVIACDNLSKKFAEGKSEVRVLENINIQISRGELVAIVGASGVGKSTLLHLLGGLDQPSAGKVLIGGVDIHNLSENSRCRLRNRYLGFVYQFHHLLPEFHAVENVAMPLLIRGDDVKDAEETAKALLSKVGLSHRFLHRVGELSGGERQRVAIARALVTKPACVLADEPTGNLDSQTAETVLELMLSLNKEFNTSFIIVTHDMNIASRMNRILKIERGTVIEQ